jgi:hypothetical protein
MAPPNREPIYRIIRLLMAADLLLGLFLLLFAAPLFGAPGLRTAGGILAAIGAVLYIFFGWLSRQARRRGGGP